jgi:phage gpG-like protein
MAGAAVTVKTSKRGGGVSGVRARLKGGLAPVMAVIAETLVSVTVESFTKQASPMGEPWAPLRPVTQARRLTKTQRKLMVPRKRGRNAGRGIALAGHLASQKALVDKGFLRASIHGKTGPNTAAVATNDVRARVHQFGNPKNRFPNGPGGRRKGAGPLAPIPARPFMPMDKNGRLMLPPGLRAELFHMLRMAIADGIVAKRGAAKSGEAITLSSGGRTIGEF